jgi:hypothetical protein
MLFWWIDVACATETCLLLHCDVAYALWSALFTRFGLFWVMPRRVFDLFACWWTFGRPRSAAIWKMVPTCLIRYVWKERNNRCFEDLEKSLEDVLASFFFFFFFFFSYFVSLDGSFCVSFVA